MPVLVWTAWGRLAVIRRRARATTPFRASGPRVGGVRPRVDALQEQRLAGPHRADAGEVALVEQGGADAGPVQVGDGLLLVEVGAEDVRAEVADQGALLAGADEVEHAQPQPGRRPLLGDQQRADVVGAASTAVEALPASRVGAAARGDGGRVRGRARDAPLALHPQVGVQRPAGVEAVQDVLAARHDLGDGLARRGRSWRAPASAGPRRPAPVRRAPRAAGAQVRKTVSPSGTASPAASGRAGSARTRRRRGRARAAGSEPSTDSPSTFSTVSFPRRVDGAGERGGRRLEQRRRRPTRTAGCGRRARRRARARRRRARRGRRPCVRAGGRRTPRAGTARAAPRRTGWPGRSRRARAPGRSAVALERTRHGPQPVDRPGAAELGRAEALDEVAAAHAAGVLGRGQHPVDAGEAARDLLGADAAAGHDAVAVEQQLGPGHAHGVVASVSAAGSGDQRPAVSGGPPRRGSGARGRARP